MNQALGRAALAALALVFVTGVHAADKKGDGKLSGNDRNFVTTAAQDGMAEVELGKIAQQNGSSAAVKQFGQRMVDDHSKANKELEDIATKVGMTPPKDPGSKHQADIKKFSKLTGEKFDREYAAHMVKDHEKAVALFRKQAKGGEAEALKAFAAKTLPNLEEHLKMARELSGQKK
jgi:putative membrane protein